MLHVRKTESGSYEIEEDGAPGFEHWPPSSFPPGTFEWQRSARDPLADLERCVGGPALERAWTLRREDANPPAKPELAARIEAAAKRMRDTTVLRGPSLPVMTHALRSYEVVGPRCPFCGVVAPFYLEDRMVGHGPHLPALCIASFKTLDQARELRELHDFAAGKKDRLPDGALERALAELRCFLCGDRGCTGSCRE